MSAGSYTLDQVKAMHKRALADLERESARVEALIRFPSFLRVVDAVSQVTGVSALEICGRGRRASVARARHIVVRAMRTTTDLSYSVLGVLLDRDHSTVVDSYRKAKAGGA